MSPGENEQGWVPLRATARLIARSGVWSEGGRRIDKETDAGRVQVVAVYLWWNSSLDRLQVTDHLIVQHGVVRPLSAWESTASGDRAWSDEQLLDITLV